jgi:hypothetical protein
LVENRPEILENKAVQNIQYAHSVIILSCDPGLLGVVSINASYRFVLGILPLVMFRNAVIVGQILDER